MTYTMKDKFGHERTFKDGYIVFFKKNPEDKEDSWYYKKYRKRLVRLLKTMKRDKKDFRVFSCQGEKEVSEQRINNWLKVGEEQKEEVLMLDD